MDNQRARNNRYPQYITARCSFKVISGILIWRVETLLDLTIANKSGEINDKSVVYGNTNEIESALLNYLYYLFLRTAVKCVNSNKKKSFHCSKCNLYNTDSVD